MDNSFVANFVSQSDAIEGLRSDEEKLLEELNTGEITDGHLKAILLLKQLVTSGSLLTKKVICQTQSLIVSDQVKKGGDAVLKKYYGQYRTVFVRVGNISFPDPKIVPDMMEIWIKKVNLWQKIFVRNLNIDNIRLAAIFHYEFERIHPFFDGNGRSGRAIAYWMLRLAKIPPFVFTNNDKWSTYYLCFGNKKTMEEYFLHRTKSAN